MKDKKLHSIKHPGFKTPEDYFDSLEQRLFSQAKLKGQLDSSGFAMPENYLNGLEDTILNKIAKEEPKVISIFSKRTWIYASSIAAAVLLLFTLSILQTKPTSFETLDIETVENYILEENVVDSYELAALMTEEELTESGFIDANFDENHIETFLLEHLEVEDLLLD